MTTEINSDLASQRHALLEQQLETAIALGLVHIYRTKLNGRMVSPCAANEQIIRGWLQLDEVPSAKWLQQVLEQNPSLAKSLVWTDPYDPEKAKKAEAQQLKQDRLEFSEFCRTHAVSEIEANFNLWRDNRNASGLVSATEAELAQWAQEVEEARREVLANADNATLRRLAHEERATQPTAAEQQRSLELKAMRIRDSAMNYPALPAGIRKYDIDTAESHELRRLIQRYGAYAVTVRRNQKD